MDLFLGIILGIFILFVYKLIYNEQEKYNLIVKSIDFFLNIDYKNYTFVDRSLDTVRVGILGNNGIFIYLFVINITNKEISIFQNINNELKLQIYTDDYNRKKMTYFYNELIKLFNTEIFVNITNINGVILSNNIIQKQNEIIEENGDIYGTKVDYYNEEPTMDDILDKINKYGTKYLTEKELEILKKYSEE